MKKLLLLYGCTCFIFKCISARATDSTVLVINQAKYVNIFINESLNQKLKDSIDYYKVNFSDTLLHNSTFLISVKEYINGELSVPDSINNKLKTPLTFYKLDSVLHFGFTLMPQKNDSALLGFRFPDVNIYRTFKTMANEKYSLKYIDGCSGFGKVPVNKPFPLFVFTQFVEDINNPGGKYLPLMPLDYSFSGDKVNIEDWWNVYHLKHFIVVELTIQKA